MNRDKQLAEVLVEFAHTLGTDFSVQTILDRLVHRVVDVLPVTAAGVMVMGFNDELHFVAASNTRIQAIESLQNQRSEGPCMDAYRSGEPIAVPDLRLDGRYPRFAPLAVEAGLAAVFTFPMSLDARRFGALDLYRDSPGELSEGDARAAQVLADVAAAYLFNAQARNEAAANLEQLRHRALHDPLTGLPNRTLFSELLEQAVDRSRRSHLGAAVLFVDIDRFKSVNDRYGHHFGDVMLVALATRLGGILRPGDTLARLAGDEFVILCQDLGEPAQAELVADRIKHALTDPLQVDGRMIEISVSVGVAFAGPGEDIPESLLRDADFAMYQAKQAGGGRHQVVDSTARLAEDSRSRLEADLRQALQGKQLQLAYQPIVRADDRSLVAVEALLRWQHSERGLVAPDVTVPIAERVGLMIPLGEWVLHQACEDFVRWRASYGPVLSHIAVNVSAQQVMGPAFAGTVAAVLAQTGMDPSCLHLEVTESAFLSDTARARAVLCEVKELGVQFSLDDFGTGYSSLTYLKHFPFDVVKISGSFIADLDGDDERARAIVAAVIGIARALELAVVAEGIETRAQLTEVIDLGTDLAQGFLLGRPLFATDLERQVLAATRPATIQLPADAGSTSGSPSRSAERP